MSRSRKKVACIRDHAEAMRTLRAAAKFLRERGVQPMSALEFIDKSGGCGTAAVFEQAVCETEQFIQAANTALDKWKLIGPFIRTGMALQGISSEKLKTLLGALRDAVALLQNRRAAWAPRRTL